MNNPKYGLMSISANRRGTGNKNLVKFVCKCINIVYTFKQTKSLRYYFAHCAITVEICILIRLHIGQTTHVLEVVVVKENMPRKTFTHMAQRFHKQE